MQSLSKDHASWLFKHFQSGLYRCPQGEASCGTYHVLAPVLHDIELLSSYKSYKYIILKLLNDVFARVNCPDIVVAGIESESSAKCLIELLEIFGKKYTVTFIDCCPTPLLRINSALEVHEKSYIHTRLLDMLDPGLSAQNLCFDIIFADSFLKQFAPPQKIAVLTAFSKMLKSAESALLIHEYFGDLNQFLPLHWNRLGFLLAKKECDWFASPDELEKFKSMVKDLDLYYKSTGTIYPHPVPLRKDVLQCNMFIAEEYLTGNVIDRVFVAKLHRS